MNKEIAKLLETAKLANCKLYAEIAEMYPPCTAIKWRRGDYIYHGEVMLTSLDRVKVRNDRTATEYWIYISDIE